MFRPLIPLFFGILVTLSAHIFAACGGGGYSAPQQSSTMRTEYYQSSQTVRGAVVAPDFSRLDKLSDSLNLSPRQNYDIHMLQADIQRMYDSAQRSGRSFDSKQEFDNRLARILNRDQMSTYAHSSTPAPASAVR